MATRHARYLPVLIEEGFYIVNDLVGDGVERDPVAGELDFFHGDVF
jgi:hypothetical protein